MTSDIFTEREKAFESKFQIDEEQRFKNHSRAVKLFGIWVAERMGMQAREAERYADSIVDLDVQQRDVDGIIRRAQKDLAAKNIEINERLLYNQFSSKLEQAHRRQIS